MGNQLRRDIAVLPPLRVRVKVVLLSLFIQAVNNFERMQSLGFAFALSPVLKWLYPKRADWARAVARNLGFFNTQPYLANCALGVVARLEVDSAPDGPGIEEVDRAKLAMMGAFGGLGDSLFWAVLVPLAALCALGCYALLPSYPVVGILVAFVGYNAVQLWVRFYFFERGLRDGYGVTRFLQKIKLPRWVTVLRGAAAVSLGAYAVLVYWRLGAVGAGSIQIKSLVLFAGISVLLAPCGQFVGRLSPSAAWYATILICLLAGVLF
jgi:mannose/fructose/N-acetylgalactosamine-specific phosphotransferase system component IID